MIGYGSCKVPMGWHRGTIDHSVCLSAPTPPKPGNCSNRENGKCKEMNLNRKGSIRICYSSTLSRGLGMRIHQNARAKSVKAQPATSYSSFGARDISPGE